MIALQTLGAAWFDTFLEEDILLEAMTPKELSNAVYAEFM